MIISPSRPHRPPRPVPPRVVHPGWWQHPSYAGLDPFSSVIGRSPDNPSPSQCEIERSFLEDGGKKGKDKAAVVPWLQDNIVQQRRQKFGLRDPRVHDFIEDCEFIGLGCFCGASRALQCLGLKKFTYPFDWVRTSVPCTAACLRRDFEDFCSYNFTGEEMTPGVQCRGGASWGGSFWHHDPDLLRVQQDFDRRIERLKGHAEVPADVTRVFALSLNSLEDLCHISELKRLLESMLPKAEIYMVVFIDNQPAAGPVCVSDLDLENVLFYWTHSSMFDHNGRDWTEQLQAETYAEGIALAIQVWAGTYRGETLPHVISIKALYEHCLNFDGGDPGEKLFWPVRQQNVQPPAHLDKECGRMLPWPLSLFFCSLGHDQEICDTGEVTMEPRSQAIALNCS